MYTALQAQVANMREDADKHEAEMDKYFGEYPSRMTEQKAIYNIYSMMVDTGIRITAIQPSKDMTFFNQGTVSGMDGAALSENIEGAELIIYTAAIMADNPELIASKEAEKEGRAYLCERADILGLITSWYDDAVCVCGTHGKTTTSSMLTQIFLDEGVDLSCVIGGKLPSINGSGRSGSSSVMVCESCEYQDHFLKFFPHDYPFYNRLIKAMYNDRKHNQELQCLCEQDD